MIRVWGRTAADREFSRDFTSLAAAEDWCAAHRATITGTQPLADVQARDRAAEAAETTAVLTAHFNYIRGRDN